MNFPGVDEATATLVDWKNCVRIFEAMRRLEAARDLYREAGEQQLAKEVEAAIEMIRILKP